MLTVGGVLLQTVKLFNLTESFKGQENIFFLYNYSRRRIIYEFPNIYTNLEIFIWAHSIRTLF